MGVILCVYFFYYYYYSIQIIRYNMLEGFWSGKYAGQRQNNCQIRNIEYDDMTIIPTNELVVKYGS